jgi:hypothetical protein
MTQNQHIQSSAQRLYGALQTVIRLGLTVEAATIGARNPTVRLAEPPRGQLTGHTVLRQFDGAKTTRRLVALVGGCQIEWRT